MCPKPVGWHPGCVSCGGRSMRPLIDLGGPMSTSTANRLDKPMGSIIIHNGQWSGRSLPVYGIHGQASLGSSTEPCRPAWKPGVAIFGVPLAQPDSILMTHSDWFFCSVHRSPDSLFTPHGTVLHRESPPPVRFASLFGVSCLNAARMGVS